MRARALPNIPAVHDRRLCGWRTLAVAIAALLGVWGRADVTWLMPDRFSATPGAVLGFGIAEGEVFGDNATHNPPGRIEKISGELAGQSLVFGPLGLADTLAKFTGTFTRPGIACVVVNFKPEARSVSRSRIESYLRQLYVTDEIRAAWQEIGPPNPWQEVRTLRLKTFVRVGEPERGDRSWALPLAEGLDVVPQADPTTVHVNDAVVVQIVSGGRPVPGIVVEFVSVGEARQHVVIADEHGRAQAPLDAKGAWLIQCFEVKRVSAGNHDWDVAISGLTLHAQ